MAELLPKVRARTGANLLLCALATALLLMCASRCQAARLRITIETSPELHNNPVVRTAVHDTRSLLLLAFPGADVSLNSRNGAVRIILPATLPGKTTCTATHPFPCATAPDASYRWHAANVSGINILRLQAATAEGISSGLYDLLQEKLGFCFYHPRESIIPRYHRWPLEQAFTFQGKPRFENRGFHLHTLHPIELTSQLHDPSLPGAFDDVKTYIDWLARNGQNTFQFYLLRGINRATWPDYARRIVGYAHQRGIRCGVEISLSMIQQQAFQAITLLRPYPGYRRQVDSTLAWLFQAPWDFVSLEPTMGEHLPFLNRLLPNIQAHLERQVAERYHAVVLCATHVIGGTAAPREPQCASSGILIHSVMCYSVSEEKAPVYGNKNQRFMLQLARTEQPLRQTWYWPESSYWVGFDTSVPLLLLPYLDARWSDIKTMASLGVNGHLTFSSGWEWGYWLIDWSIARWSWQLQDNGTERPTSPLSRLAELCNDQTLRRLMAQALALQNQYLKDKELLRFMAALTPFSELPPPFNKPFQPEPKFRYGWLLNDATPAEARQALAQPVADLEKYALHMGEIVDLLEERIEQLRAAAQIGEIQHKLLSELERGLRVTALRASHRALTLKALLAKRSDSQSRSAAALLARARLVRQQAQIIVRQQEGIYRYPVGQIARRHVSMTAYPFGYLYPASRLFFWEREEEQVEHERFDALFMNLWDVRRTLGLGSLFFK
ncbi:MAG: hypothetical protein PHH28_01735 [Desulfuromonadaceae bacterium]|nr:hypothetical protein [Desulfuromonadaceae bacterium]